MLDVYSWAVEHLISTGQSVIIVIVWSSRVFAWIVTFCPQVGQSGSISLGFSE